MPPKKLPTQVHASYPPLLPEAKRNKEDDVNVAIVCGLPYVKEPYCIVMKKEDAIAYSSVLKNALELECRKVKLSVTGAYRTEEEMDLVDLTELARYDNLKTAFDVLFHITPVDKRAALKEIGDALDIPLLLTIVKNYLKLVLQEYKEACETSKDDKIYEDEYDYDAGESKKYRIDKPLANKLVDGPKLIHLVNSLGFQDLISEVFNGK